MPVPVAPLAYAEEALVIPRPYWLEYSYRASNSSFLAWKQASSQDGVVVGTEVGVDVEP